jgi:hypothetical protein
MKKFAALVCALAMALSFTVNAFAADLDYMDKTCTSYDSTVQFSLELNKPLQVANALSELIIGEESEYDIQRIVESLMKAEYTANIKTEESSDRLKNKTELELSANVPIEFSDDLSLAVGTKLKMWIDMDLTSRENAKYVIIIKNPLNGKYYKLDYLKLFENIDDEESANSVFDTLKKNLQNDSKILNWNEIIKNVVSGNAKITSLGNTRKIEISGDAMSKYITDLIEGFVNSEYMDEIFATLEESNPDVKADTQSYLAEIKDVIGKLKIFADDAVITNVTLDKSGFVNTAEEKVHISFNLAELLKGFDVDEEEIYPITKENSDVDFTMGMKVTYTNVNDTKVTIPTLTEENSVDLVNLYDYSDDDADYDSDYWDEYFYRTSEFFYDYVGEGHVKPIDLSKSEFYVQFENFLSEAIAWDEDNPSYELGLDGEGNISIKISTLNFEKTITAKIGETAYTVNGVQYEAKYPFVLDNYEAYNYETEEFEQSEDKDIFVSDDVLKNILNCKISSFSVYFDEDGTNRYSLNFKRNNEGYDPNYAVG